MNRNKDRAVTALISVCVIAIIACAAYLFYNYSYLPRKINARNAEYAALYSPVQTPGDEHPETTPEISAADTPIAAPETTPAPSSSAAVVSDMPSKAALESSLPTEQPAIPDETVVADNGMPAADNVSSSEIPPEPDILSSMEEIHDTENTPDSEISDFENVPDNEKIPGNEKISDTEDITDTENNSHTGDAAPLDEISDPEIFAIEEDIPLTSVTEADGENELIDVPLGTPGPDTIVYSAPTMPPVQESFADLMAFNPETVGFLRIRDLALPVVQRQNDNSFYLTHDFEGAESPAGSLFLDGVNRLYPGDNCLFVYGHNMKNGAMFGELTDFSSAKVIKENPIIRFDTIYRDGEYVPFACFELTADRSKSNYFQLRAFSFTEESFIEYSAELKKRSLVNIPIDIRPTDELLILITCDYNIDDGRFVLACRRLRDGETESSVRAIVGQSVAN